MLSWNNWGVFIFGLGLNQRKKQKGEFSYENKHKI